MRYSLSRPVVEPQADTLDPHSRVYFSTPPNASPSDDYLVDHSIFFYLMDPSNKFVDAFGRSMGAKEVVGKVEGYLREFEEGGGRGSWSDSQ